jgi:hypothetical protein
LMLKSCFFHQESVQKYIQRTSKLPSNVGSALGYQF